jgi:hypothetical protein
MPHDRKRRPSESGAHGLAAWFHLIVWGFVTVPWWVLVVFHPVQDARMFWRAVTHPASSGPTIAEWLGQSYGHVLPIWFRVRPQPNETKWTPMGRSVTVPQHMERPLWGAGQAGPGADHLVGTIEGRDSSPWVSRPP